MINVDYGLTRSFPNVSLGEARERITEALKEEGFGILTEIDVKETLKKKLDVDFRPYLILGACKPPIAHQALEKEPGIGLLLPCNAVIAETNEGGSEVSIVKPEAMFSLVKNREFQPLVAQVTESLTRALENA
jgi:uncharacterized protein (DUF302 family)